MKYLICSRAIIIAVVFFLGSFGIARGQLTGTKLIAASGGDYTTIAAAITALNTSGVGAGGVTFNVGASGSTAYTETITATLSLTATGTLANPIVFQKNPASTAANPLITAYTGGVGTPSSAVQDGIWRMLGSDYVTIGNIDVTDNAANTTNPATMEYGYALYKASVADGCQNVTIRNCVITLNYINNATGAGPMRDGSTGIIVMNATATAAVSALTPTSASGANSNNAFNGNTIQQCNTGIAIVGYAASSPFTLADVNNSIGVSSSNVVLNYGGASGATNAAVGINTLNQYGLTISNNFINNSYNNGVPYHPNAIRGILVGAALSANTTITNNSITLHGGGTTQIVAGIENASGATPASNTVNISSNTVSNCDYGTATTGGFYGIFNNAANPANLTITNNNVNSNYNAATGTGLLYGIYNTGAATIASITSNVFSGNAGGNYTTGIFAGIYNTAAAGTLNINGNNILGSVSFSTSGLFIPIYNTGIITTAININSNFLGNASNYMIGYGNANSGNQVYINNTAGGTSATLSISSNSFYGILYNAASTGANTFISNTAATLSQDINNNVFYSSTINSSGSLTFIVNNIALTATGIQNINSNSISGTFNKSAAGGNVTLFNSTATCASGSVVNHNNNNFSNITVTGATAIAGWSVTDAGAANHNIQNNTFTNWSGSTSNVNALTVSIAGTNAISGNIINTISGAGAITGITASGGNNQISQNFINTLSSSGAFAVTAINITGGTTQNIFKNKLYDISNSNVTGNVNGLLLSAGTTTNIYNNLIGDLRVTTGSSATDLIRGINITSTTVSSTINAYYNTIFINATSSGTNFSTTGVYHAASATTTTATLNLRNNSITNTSTAKGTGLTVAYRRSSNTLGNYASTSNNNHFYAGTPSATNLIFTDGTTPQQTLANYKALASLSPRDQASVTEDLSTKFLSTTGSSANYLHINTTLSTAIKSAAANISGFTDDFDSQIRAGNTGYTGVATNPDIGADEILSINSWLGVTSTDWNVTSNWSNGVPTTTTDVDFASGKSNYPVLTAGTYSTRNINLHTGSSVTLTAGTLQIGGSIATGGTFTATAAAGTIEINGTSAQTIPVSTFATNTINNLKINNSTGVTLAGTLNVTGILYPALGTLTTGGFLTLISSATQTALIDGTGAGTLSGNVTMQRYLASAYGYKYISSPMQAATVGSFSSLVDLGATFSNFYTYIENNASSGFTAYTSTSNVLTPLKGYAVDFGASATPATISITGAVNNGALSATISNTNQTYTQGFNLVGNPYPSPIDWNASTGWTKTNIDNAIYYFDSGTTTQYTGTYSTYINGVSSDGVANNILASMQGFFVHVSNGPFPVTGALGLTNAVRVNNLSPVFHKATGIATNTAPRMLVRLSAGFTGDDKAADAIVLYSDTGATKLFNNQLDAIKLLNTNDMVPNFYTLAKKDVKLAITSLAAVDSNTTIPLSIHTVKTGLINFNMLTADNLPQGLNVYLYDAYTKTNNKLAVGQKASVNLAAGDYDNRFYLNFKPLEEPVKHEDVYYLYRKNGYIFANIKLQNEQSGNLSLINITGNVITNLKITGNGIYNLGSPKALGIYVVSFVTPGGIHAKKIFVPE